MTIFIITEKTGEQVMLLWSGSEKKKPAAFFMFLVFNQSIAQTHHSKQYEVHMDVLTLNS